MLASSPKTSISYLKYPFNEWTLIFTNSAPGFHMLMESVTSLLTGFLIKPFLPFKKYRYIGEGRKKNVLELRIHFD